VNRQQGKRILNFVVCRPSLKSEVCNGGQTPKSLLEHFSSVDDPRIDRTKRHKLIDIDDVKAHSAASIEARQVNKGRNKVKAQEGRME
jgi:hypothetical protein